MTQPVPSAASSSATSRVAASTSPTLTAWTHTTCRPATAARNVAGTRPSRCPNPARYRPLVAIRASQYGAPTTSTAIRSALYSAITTNWTKSANSLAYDRAIQPGFTTVSAKIIINPA